MGRIGTTPVSATLKQSVEQTMALQGSDESTSGSGESWVIFILQGWQNNCGYTAVHAQIWSGASIEFRRNRAPRNRGRLGTKNPREAVKMFEEREASYKSYRIFTNRVLNRVRLSVGEVAHQLG